MSLYQLWKDGWFSGPIEVKLYEPTSDQLIRYQKGESIILDGPDHKVQVFRGIDGKPKFRQLHKTKT